MLVSQIKQTSSSRVFFFSSEGQHKRKIDNIEGRRRRRIWRVQLHGTLHSHAFQSMSYHSLV